MQLSSEERDIAAGSRGEAQAMAMRIVAETGRLLGADRLIPVHSSHIDGALYHGDSGVLFAEKLVELGGKVAVPSTLNVGGLDLMHPKRVRLTGLRRDMALRLMKAYEALGCKSTWTCSPYQAGHRPPTGVDVAWGESNAVAFCNSVLGARTNRYGDFLDIACALIARAPRYGLHLPENRRARLLVDTSGLSAALRDVDAFWPVIGAWVGRRAGNRIVAIDGLQASATEDRMKALGAAAASYGAVGLFHILGITPEAKTKQDAFGEAGPEETIRITADMVREARGWLSTTSDDNVDAIAVGSPHLSFDEMIEIHDRLGDRKVKLPFYAHTGRHVLKKLEAEGKLGSFQNAGITIVADTCIVATPILPDKFGTLLTNSGKFANYTPGNTGWAVVYGSMAECVETAVRGQIVRDEVLWQ